MSSPQVFFQNALTSYESLPSLAVSIDTQIRQLDNSINTYHNSPTDSNKTAVQNAFQPIAAYYNKLNEINTNLASYINKVSQNIADSQDTLVNEERYIERVHPEESVGAREAMHGMFSKFRTTSIPYILTAGVFMSLLSIFIVFQLFGLTGEVNLPPAFAQYLSTPAETISLPFYKRPIVLGGLVIVLVSALIMFIILYFKAKSTNQFVV